MAHPLLLPDKLVNLKFQHLASLELFWQRSSPYVCGIRIRTDADEKTAPPFVQIGQIDEDGDAAVVSKRIEPLPQEMVRIMYVDMFPLPRSSTRQHLFSGLEITTSQGRSVNLQNDTEEARLSRTHLNKMASPVREHRSTHVGFNLDGFIILQTDDVYGIAEFQPMWTRDLPTHPLDPSSAPATPAPPLPQEQTQRAHAEQKAAAAISPTMRPTLFSMVRSQLPSFALGFFGMITFAMAMVKIQKDVNPNETLPPSTPSSTLNLESSHGNAGTFKRQRIQRLSFVQ